MAFADSACAAIFPLAEPIPSPPPHTQAFSDALDAAHDNDDDQINHHCDMHLYRLKELAAQFGPEPDELYRFAPELIPPAAGKWHFAICAQLAEFLAH